MSTPEQDKAKELADAIRQLGEVFLGRIPAAMSAMEDELTKISRNARDQESWKTLHRHLHSMAGSAGTFGYDELGDRARELEDRINIMMKANDFTAEPTKTDFINAQRAFMNWVDVNFIQTFE